MSDIHEPVIELVQKNVSKVIENAKIEDIKDIANTAIAVVGVTAITLGAYSIYKGHKTKFKFGPFEFKSESEK